jgi:ADP-ribose pyrophosphatase YjhB (NUDIX family)
VVFNNNNQVLLIRRGKAPSKGMISFPGGRQELGETVIECAIREAKEECGIDLRHDPRLLRNVERIGATRVPRAYLQSRTLEHPIPFTAVDVMSMSEEDARETELEKMLYHYAIIEVAAMVADPSQVPVAADDADEAFWWDCDEFLTSDNPDIVPNLKHVVETVLSTFDFT